MKWLTEFSEPAARTDRLIGNPNHQGSLLWSRSRENFSLTSRVRVNENAVRSGQPSNA